jgi:NAD(P)-dependent dehydrogenase (short-subunit alcohol dehydrogenase family)
MTVGDDDPGAGRTVVLTGATSGIGAAAAEVFATRVDTLVLHGPEPEAAVAEQLGRLRRGRARVHYVPADFDRLAAVVELADRIAELAPHVDVLVNNAGRPGPPRRRLSADGHETTLQTNYLAAVLLTDRLLPLLVPGRVVHVASATHHMAELDPADLDLARGAYSDVAAYARSKLAMIGHALWLAEHLRGTGTEVVSISPGVISTSLLHAMFDVGGAPTEHGARNVVEAALSPEVVSGQYLDDGRPATPSALARDRGFQRALHDATEAVLHLRRAR